MPHPTKDKLKYVPSYFMNYEKCKCFVFLLYECLLLNQMMFLLVEMTDLAGISLPFRRFDRETSEKKRDSNQFVEYFFWSFDTYNKTSCQIRN